MSSEEDEELMLLLLFFITCIGFKQVHSALTKIESSSQIQQARSATYLCIPSYS